MGFGFRREDQMRQPGIQPTSLLDGPGRESVSAEHLDGIMKEVHDGRNSPGHREIMNLWDPYPAGTMART